MNTLKSLIELQEKAALTKELVDISVLIEVAANFDFLSLLEKMERYEEALRYISGKNSLACDNIEECRNAAIGALEGS